MCDKSKGLSFGQGGGDGEELEREGSQVGERRGDQNRNRYFSKGVIEERADLKTFSGSFPMYYFCSLP